MKAGASGKAAQRVPDQGVDALLRPPSTHGPSSVPDKLFDKVSTTTF